MDMLPLCELQELDNSLDLFDTPPYPADLLNRGIYPGLAVSSGSLLWGFHILRQARELKLESLACRTYLQPDRETALQIALGLENRAGKYSWEEIERILLLVEHLENLDLTLIRLIEGHSESSIVNKFRRYTTLCAPLKNLVKENALNLKTALEIQELPEEVFIHFQAAGSSLKLSFSEKRIFLVSFYEICCRDRLAPPAALELFKQLIGTPAPLAKLRILRYPRLSRMEEQFFTFKQNYLKGSGIELKAPEYFEGSQFYAGFSFTPKNLAQKIKSIQRIQEHVDELDGLL